MGLLTLIWNGITWLGGLILPVFAKARSVRLWGAQLFWVLHFILLAGILVGLWYVNERLRLGVFLERAPAAFLRHVWLPALFLLCYLILWALWWVIKLARESDEPSAFPDIDAAWDEALRTLKLAGIDIAQQPLFLLMGRSAGAESALFHAADMELVVDQAPRRGDAPLHVYASAEGIFVTCAGASLLARQAELLAEESAPPAARPLVQEAYVAPGVAQGRLGTNPFKTLNIPEPREAARVTPPREDVSVESAAALLKDRVQVDTRLARLRHLCRLIVRDRRPACPLNGVLLLVPWKGTAGDESASQVGAICREDLQALGAVVQQHLPVFMLFCDLEKQTGFREFVDRLPAERRGQCLGLRFPYVLKAAAGQAATLADEGTRWTCRELFPALVYRLLGTGDALALAGNERLYELMYDVRQRERRLARIIALALGDAAPGPLLFNGFYLAATGRDPQHEQAFVADLFERLLENQNYVSWTETALKREAEALRWTRVLSVGVAAALVAALGFWLLRRIASYENLLGE